MTQAQGTTVPFTVRRGSKTLNRSEIIADVADSLGRTVEDVEKVVTEFFEHCTKALANGEPVAVRRFGKFEPRLRRAMIKPNPKTGLEMAIPERLSATFLPSDLLKERLNGEAA